MQDAHTLCKMNIARLNNVPVSLCIANAHLLSLIRASTAKCNASFSFKKIIPA